MCNVRTMKSGAFIAALTMTVPDSLRESGTKSGDAYSLHFRTPQLGARHHLDVGEMG